ncbi:MAG: leukotoxin LktA family filamentous adhesin [Planctomycetaceae bacterium]|nr:leukotoxin LktA family filamentous adhesin [Planctomycetaceae bacterium]
MRLSYRKFIQQAFQKVVVFLTCAAMLVPAPVLMAQSPPIVADGRTQTTVTSNPAGTMTDVRTDTIKGINAYNSFERFNVPGGNTTNLFVPDSAKNLINLVHGERSQIDGVLNSYKDGQIGGNVFFMNPHGIVIGPGGVVNVGSLHLQTPTSDYLNKLVNEHGEISMVHEQMLFDGTVPISPSGLISVKGKVNAVSEIQLKAGNIDLAAGSQVRAGRQVLVEFGDLVNIQKMVPHQNLWAKK